ncbi:MAG TPA: response regulator [Candidatus Obscuribacterales bacterium]
MHVLHIDDGANYVPCLAGLQQRGHRVQTVHSLQEALERLKAESFDIVLMELSQVDSSGIESLEKVKVQCPDLPLVVITAIDDIPLAVETINSGAEDYLLKGTVNDDLLLQRLRFAIERNRKRKRSNQKLERLVQERTEKLMRSNEELRQFARIASHDLQEPLRAVQGFASLLAESAKAGTDSSSAEFIDQILAGTERMTHLIKSILTHSQITSDESENQLISCDSVIDEVLNDFSSLIKDTGARFEIGTLPLVAVERSQVIQLFQNLIGNALKYRSCDQPVIHVSAQANHNNWLFSVRDNGIGIEPQYADKIFDMFVRLHGKLAYPGTGMGLAICKKVVTSHGGTIWVESKPGEGSIFLFTLPAAKTSRRTKMQDCINILLVEDTPSDIRLTEEALKRTDLVYELTVTNDGVEAMEYLHQIKDAAAKKLPDIILLDLNMPRKNGHEVLHDIKNDPQLKSIPVVLLTVSEDDHDVEEALRLRMSYYLAKPVKPERLYVLVEAIKELHAAAASGQSQHSNEETHVRQVLAGNPHTAQVALSRLAADENANIRSRVAANPNVPLPVLQKLAEDESAEVRLSVAENPCVPLAVLKRLIHDRNEDVRLALSGNRHLPVDLLKQLTQDENVHVAGSAVNTLAGLQQTEQPTSNR